MYSTEELRRALTDEVADRSTRLTFAQVRAAGQRRRRRRTLAGVAAAALVPLVAGGAVAAVQPGYGPGPVPVPTLGPTMALPAVPEASEPARTIDPVHTGLTIAGGEEFVMWYQADNGRVRGGLFDAATTRIRPLDDGLYLRGTTAFQTVYELDDRQGGAIDYGVVTGDGLGVQVTSAGNTVKATTGSLPGLTGVTVFWVGRSGVLAGPTGAMGIDPGAEFKATNGATTRAIQRSDGVVNRDDNARPIGDRIDTGLVLADGSRLVFWFEGDDRGAQLRASADNGSGTLRPVNVLGNLNRPPFAIGFYGGVHEFALAGGRRAVVGIYAGPAATVEMAGAEAHGSGAWSAHPELRVFWGVGLRGNPSGVARDRAGKVLLTTDFREPGGR